MDKRRRIHKKLEKYPNPRAWIRFLDRLLLVVAVLGPISALPQVIKIFVLRSVEGVSFLSWSMWLILGIPWLIYGFVHKNKPIIAAYTLWFIMNLAVIIGILIYG